MLTIYKASAGSGKTFTLSATFIAHLLSDSVDHPHKHQLAVTFTNKATAEMKIRILQNLYSIAHSHDDQDGFFQAVMEEAKKCSGAAAENMTPAAIRHRAMQVLGEMIHDYDHFHVKTIDSFFQSILSNLAHEVGLSANFKVELGDSDILGRAVERFMEGVNDNSDELDWLLNYIRKRLEDDTSWNVATQLRQLATELLKERYMLKRHLLHLSEQPDQEAARREGCVNLDNATVNAYREVLLKQERQTRKVLAEAAEEAAHIIEGSMGYEKISYGSQRVKPFIDQCADANCPYKQIKEPNETLKQYAAGAKPFVKGGKKAGVAEHEAENVQLALDQLLQTYYECGYTLHSCALSLENIYPLRLLDCIDKEVEQLNRENDRFLLAYTPLLFHELTGDADTSFVFERAGTQFRHVMIDEFQDTSPLQWTNMRHLLVESMAQGNSCMIVGDVKQGIYRFRGGDWNTLANFQECRNNNFAESIEIKTLKRNFRSGETVVDFNNRLFVAASGVVDDQLKADWDYRTNNLPEQLSARHIYPIPDPANDSHEVTQIPVKAGGYVRVEFLPEEKKKEQEEKTVATPQEDTDDICVEERLAQEILNLNEQGVPLEEMAILVRTNNDTTTLLRHFEAHHPEITLVSEEAFLLGASPAVQILIHALRYIVNNTDAISLAYLQKHCRTDEWNQIVQQLDLWNSQHYGGLPFYEITTRLVALFHLEDSAGQSPYLYAFLDTLLKYIDENTADVKQFLQQWDERLHRTAIPSAAVKGVRILTIHKSKGLAFHTVLIPYCDWVVDDVKKPERVWVTPDDEPYNAIPLLPIVLKKEAGNSIYQDLYLQEYYNRFIESLNLMYVAFTRTRQNLLIWASLKGKVTTVAHILHASMLRAGLLQQTEGKKLANVVTIGTPSILEIKRHDDAPLSGDADSAEQRRQKDPAPLEIHSRVVNLDFSAAQSCPQFRQSQQARIFIEAERAIDTTAPADAAEKEQRETFRQTGILLHELMSVIETAADVEPQVKRFIQQGLLPAGKKAENLRRLILLRLRHPIARQWFDGSWRLYREATLIYRNAAGEMVSQRPDRVMTKGGETIVVDFKFGRPEPEHSEQVSEYARLLQRQDKTRVRAYLWYLYKGDIVEVQL